MDLARELSRHEFGIPRISTSVLSEKEKEYLELARGLDVESDGNMAVKSAILLENDTIRDTTLFRLVEKKDELSDLLQAKSQAIVSLEKQRRELNEQNVQLHDRNSSLVGQITDKMASLRQEQQNAFNEEQMEQYTNLKESLNQTKIKSAVLKEFMTMLVAAAGIDWTTDQTLMELVSMPTTNEDDNELMN